MRKGVEHPGGTAPLKGSSDIPQFLRADGI
jgi:hypothetical protein